MMHTRRLRVGHMGRMSVQLLPTGKYSATPYEDPNDGEAALAIIQKIGAEEAIAAEITSVQATNWGWLMVLVCIALVRRELIKREYLRPIDLNETRQGKNNFFAGLFIPYSAAAPDRFLGLRPNEMPTSLPCHSYRSSMTQV